MRELHLSEADQARGKRIRAQRIRRVTTCLAAVVVFCTTYALILPAITMEHVCGMEEHTHTDACYTQVDYVTKRVPVCTEESLGLHEHTADCYDEAGELICGTADFVVHQHDEWCYDEDGVLWCELPETEEHEHDEDCYELPRAHEHGEECYLREMICGMEEQPAHEHVATCCDADGRFICGLEASEGHEHGEECWQETLLCEISTEPIEGAEPVLVCEEEETVPHEHTARCYDESGALVCGRLALTAHQHDETCFESIEVPAEAGPDTLTCTNTDEDHEHTARCYGTWVLTCGMEEHTHTDDCKRSEEEPEEDNYICGLEEHEHDGLCRDADGELICGLEEHEHTADCLAADEEEQPEEEVYFCGLTAHIHEDDCYGLFGMIVCGMEEHIHTADCLTAPLSAAELAEVEDVIAAIDALPTSDELGEELAELELEMDETAIENWYLNVYAAYQQVRAAYDALTEAQKEKVTNAETLLSLGELWDVMELPSFRFYTEKKVVYEVKSGGEWVTVGVSGYSSDGSGRAYITQEQAVSVFGEYGYTAGSALSYSYNDIYHINYAYNTGYRMDYANAECKEGTVIWLYQANDTDAQKFRIWDAGDGYSFITPLRNSGLHVNVNGGGNTEGTKLWLHSETDNASRWRVNTRSDGKTTFANANDETKMIDLSGGTVENSNQLQIWTYGENNAVFWKLEQIYEWSNADTTGRTILLTQESNGNIVCRYDPNGMTDGNEIRTPADLHKLENSGSYTLVNDITITETPESGAAVTVGSDVEAMLDLNGHTIRYAPAAERAYSLISLSDGASLTITDTTGEAAQDAVKADVSRSNYGNLASWNESSKTLTYYVTDPEVNSDGITTTDTLWVITVDLTNVGAIESVGANCPDQLISIDGNAELTIAGGRITNEGGFHAIHTAAKAPTIRITGGYLCGSASDASMGGAIYASGTFEMSGGVVAANQARGNGAGIYYQEQTGGGTFEMSGGVISGNHILGKSDSTTGIGYGAGVCCWMSHGGNAEFSGGYVTNNRSDYFCGNVGEGSHGGAGIFLYNGNMTVAGDMYVTGNYDEESAGGIAFQGNQFTMTGGYVSSNVAGRGEAGGIRFSVTNKIALIVGGYITNNATNTNHDWGGGGIFVQGGASLQIKNALISQNYADGFGGGVAGCPTGQLVLEGETQDAAVDTTAGAAALYGNTAAGRTMAGSDGIVSAKPQDQNAKNSEVFMTSGYQDFFCALNSIVSGTMLGGGSENYSGSCDYKPISFGQDEIRRAQSMMGLTANPTDADIEKGIEAAGVFISGNSSGTHGGGILSNGVLVLGEASEVALTPGLQILVPKAYQNQDGEKYDLAEGQFSFLLLDDRVTVNADGTVNYTEENIVDRQSNNASGYVVFEPPIPTEGTGGDSVVTYYLMEEAGSGAGGITYDATVYRIVLGTTHRTETLTLAANKSLTIHYYLVHRVRVDIANASGVYDDGSLSYGDSTTRVDGNCYWSGTGGSNSRLTVTWEEGFTNKVDDTPLYFQLTKYDGNKPVGQSYEPMAFVQFTLKDQDGNVIETKKTDADGLVSFQLERSSTYQLHETVPEGYREAGPWLIVVDDNGNAKLYEGPEATGTATELTAEQGTNTLYLKWTLKNYSGYALPSTGGSGTGWYTAGGGLMLAAAVWLARRKRGARV